jgi:pantothenate kinase-related protein Tda10
MLCTTRVNRYESRTNNRIKLEVMIRKKQENYGPYVIDLTGPQGNAFVLLGYAKQFARQLKFDDELKNKIVTEMQESDYEHLVETFDKYFGEFVILER